MIRSTIRFVVAATAFVAAQAHAAVASTEIDFTGVMTSATSYGTAPQTSPAVGETFTASLTLFTDPVYTHSHTDGATYNVVDAVDSGSPVVMTGYASFSGGSSIAFTTTRTVQYFVFEVDRGTSSGVDSLSLTSMVLGQGNDGARMLFTIRQAPDASTHSLLFSDPNGGLSFYQSLNLAGDGVSATGSFLNTSEAQGSNWAGGFDLTGISVKEVSAVPEPAGALVMLAGVGLAGASLRRRRQA